MSYNSHIVLPYFFCYLFHKNTLLVTTFLSLLQNGFLQGDSDGHRISPWGKAMMTVICQMWGKFTPDRGEDRVRKPKYLNQKN